jgi:hypothetical protein
MSKALINTRNPCPVCIAEHAERERMVLGKNALGPQRRRHRYGETLGQAPEAVGRVVMLDAGAGKDRDPSRWRLATFAEEGSEVQDWPQRLCLRFHKRGWNNRKSSSL